MGGAAETLLQTFIDINEKVNDFKLVVFSMSEDVAIDMSQSYKNTEYIYINTNSAKYKIKRAIRFIINKFTNIKIKNEFISQVCKYHHRFIEVDGVLIESNINYPKYIKMITNKPIGLHLHNDYINIQNEKESTAVIENLDFIICVSSYIKNRVLEVSIKSNCNISTVYNGINLKRFNNFKVEDNIKLKNQLNFLDSDRIIVFAGRLQESKGVKLLIEAFLKLLSFNNVKLLIIGASGFSRSKKTKFIRQIELLTKKARDKIIFTGYINNEEIHKYYNLADFCVLPSIATEAFAITTIEALASSLPVILTDSGGMPEAIDENCGFILKRDSNNLSTDLYNTMNLLLNDKSLLNRMAIAAKKRSISFSSENYYKAISTKLKSI